MNVRIGIASNHLIHPTERFGTNFIDYIQRDYVTGLRKAGTLPVVLPLGDPNEAEDYIAGVDGYCFPVVRASHPSYMVRNRWPRWRKLTFIVTSLRLP